MISAGASYTNTTISSSCLLPEPLSQCDHLQPYGGDVGLVPYNHFLSSSSFPHCQGNITTASTSIDGTIIAAAEELSSHSNAILYNLSVLTDKVHQLQSLVDVVTISPPRLHHHHHFNGELIQLPLDGATHDDQLAIAAMDNQIQDIILIASSMISTCQQLAISNSTNSPNVNMMTTHDHVLLSSQLSDHQRPSNVYVGSEDGDRGTFFIANNEHPPHNPWFPCSADNYVDNNHHQQSISNSCSDTINNHNNKDKKMTMVMVEMELLHDDDDEDHHKVKNEDTIDDFPHKNYEIVELKAEVLLAKYTHYCQVCGKGFKREANLKMHMRAHGDEYKSSTSLSNHMKNGDISSTGGTNSCYSKLFPRKYSCPHEGCRWNKKHPKFQPLKSMICVKNHYKRSHCPKMYICNRCNQKQFSVLSDLRTHEKHCGDVKWQCSCGTTFSRKDKLLGHCDLFFGHSPAGTSLITRLPVKFGIHTERIFVH